jgi:hypothetical protein
MGNDESKPVSVSRRIDAPAEDIFQLLTDPGRHFDFDGSGMVRQGASNAVVSGVGDVFVMKMHNERLGDYEMINYVVEFELDRRIGWAPARLDDTNATDAADAGASVGAGLGHRWIYELTPDGADATVVTEIYECSDAPEWLREAVDNGSAWVEAMTKTLERLDDLCAK